MDLYQLGYIWSYFVFACIIFGAWKLRYVALRTLAWIVRKAKLLALLPVVFVQCWCNDKLNKAVRKQLNAIEAERYAQRNQ